VLLALITQQWSSFNLLYPSSVLSVIYYEAKPYFLVFYQQKEGAKIGEKIFFEGYEGEPDKELNPKKKIFESLKPVLHCLDPLLPESSASCYSYPHRTRTSSSMQAWLLHTETNSKKSWPF